MSEDIDSGVTAQIIADSVSPDGVRLTTMKLRFHRYILPEWNTHRVLSRNAASSRAIPVKKMVQQVWHDPAMPVKLQKNKRGMQSEEDLPVWKQKTARIMWKTASKLAASSAWVLDKLGVHKQWCNRLTEPFQFVDVVVTATEWENFFKLRYHEDAQPEIYELAKNMKKAMDNSVPKKLKPGEWHLPFLKSEETNGSEYQPLSEEYKIPSSVARSARVSYRNHDKSDPNPEKDYYLYGMLYENGHMSPFEHVATPMEKTQIDESRFFGDEHFEDGVTHIDTERYVWSGNLRGWIQYRQTV